MKLEAIEYKRKSQNMEVEMKREEEELESHRSEKKLEEMELEAMEYKVESLMMEVKMKHVKEKLESPVSGVIVLGGLSQDGESLTSVEGFIFREGRWIELPPMNIPRFFAASVLVYNQIIVSGGVTGNTITYTIETLNLDEIPLQWITSRAMLPVPLSGHKTVVHQGKLITIGGHDGNEGRNSDKIYEVPLLEPYTPRILALLPERKAWHGAELVNDKIFIFGGGRNPGVPNNEIVVCDLSSDKCSVISQLPYRVEGMATVCLEKKVFLLGGVNESGEELDKVITYDTESGETTRLPSMRQKRGGCCAVICPTVESSGGCSSDTSIDILVALGSLRQTNTVERFDFHSHAWSDMPPTSKVRDFCTAVVSHANFNNPE